jgi:hypothetical protein
MVPITSSRASEVLLKIVYALEGISTKIPNDMGALTLSYQLLKDSPLIGSTPIKQALVYEAASLALGENQVHIR